MKPEHKAKMIEGVKAYHKMRKLQAEQEQQKYDQWVFNEQQKLFAKAKRASEMESRIRELESRLSKYEPLHA